MSILSSRIGILVAGCGLLWAGSACGYSLPGSEARLFLRLSQNSCRIGGEITLQAGGDAHDYTVWARLRGGQSAAMRLRDEVPLPRWSLPENPLEQGFKLPDLMRLRVDAAHFTPGLWEIRIQGDGRQAATAPLVVWDDESLRAHVLVLIPTLTAEALNPAGADGGPVAVPGKTVSRLRPLEVATGAEAHRWIGWLNRNRVDYGVLPEAEFPRLLDLPAPPRAVLVPGLWSVWEDGWGDILSGLLSRGTKIFVQDPEAGTLIVEATPGTLTLLTPVDAPYDLNSSIKEWGFLELPSFDSPLSQGGIDLEKEPAFRTALELPPAGTNPPPQNSEMMPGLYGGSFVSLLTREFGGILAAAFCATGENLPLFEAYANGTRTAIPFRDDGEEGDYTAGDGLGTFLHQMPPMEEDGEFLLPLIAGWKGRGEVLWPYLQVVSAEDACITYREAEPRIFHESPNDPLHSFVNVEGAPPVPGGGMAYPPVDITFQAMYRKIFGGRPHILLGGFSPVRVEQGRDTPFRVEAAVYHPYGLERVQEVRVLFQGHLAATLNDAGLTGDRVPGDGIFGRTMVLRAGLPEGDLLLSLVAVDSSGRESDPWPYFAVHSGTGINIPKWGGRDPLAGILLQKKRMGTAAYDRWRTNLPSASIAAGLSFFLLIGLLAYQWKRITAQER